MLRKLAFVLAVAAGATLQFASPAPAAVADGVLAGRTSLIDNTLIDKVQYESAAKTTATTKPDGRARAGTGAAMRRAMV